MAGVEKIVEKIMSKANADTQDILQEAQQKAEKILEACRAEGTAQADRISAKSAADLQNYDSRIQSSIELNRRRAFLAARQEIISEMVEKAYAGLAAADDKEYFEMLLMLIGQNAQPCAGEIAFSGKDAGRLPSDFVRRADEAARAKGGSLKPAGKTANIENGFVLIYGDIEENCSLRAIFDARKDELVDLVHGILS